MSKFHPKYLAPDPSDSWVTDADVFVREEPDEEEDEDDGDGYNEDDGDGYSE